MSSYAKILSLAYNSAEATKTTALKTYWRSARLLKEAGTENPGKPSYMTNVLLNGKCIDAETRCLYVFYIDTYFGSAWIIEINIDTRVQTVVYYDKYNAIGFNALHKFRNAKVSHGKLIWTDNFNPIYQMDIKRAKESFYHQIGYGQFPETTEWSPVVSYSAGQNVSDGNDLYKALVNNYNVVPRWDTSQATWQYLCRVEEAYYSMNVENFYFEAMPPKSAPVVTYKSDETRKINSLRQVLYQFAYRYVYMDWRKSTFSPASTVPVPQAEEEVTTGLASGQIALNNKLDIVINSGGEEVRSIEVIARSSEDPSKWFLIDTINKLDESSQVSRRITPAYVPLTLTVMQPTVQNISAPDPPTALAATNIGATVFTANWSAPSGGPYGYYLDIATDINFTSYLSGYHGLFIAGDLLWAVTGLTAGQAYYYRLRALDAFTLMSAYSETITVTTILTAPLSKDASNVTSNSMRSNWGASEGATGYYLDVATDAIFTAFVAGFNNKDVANVLYWDIAGLVVDTDYFYRVRAYNALVTSSNSGTISQRTAAPPDAPVATAATAITLYGFTANWEEAAGATGYYLDVSTNIGFTSFVSGYNNRFIGNNFSYPVTGLSPATIYYYRVRAVNLHNLYSAYSNIITVASKMPAPVTLPATGIIGTEFYANWTSIVGATAYILDVSLHQYFATFVLQNVNVGNVVTYKINGLTVGYTYYYRVRATNGSLTSDYSNTTNQRTSDPLRDPIALPVTEKGLTSFRAAWESAVGAVGHLLYVATDATFVNHISGYNGLDVASELSWNVTGLSAGTTYYFRVKAYDIKGITSAYSNIVSVTLSLVAPSGLSATEITTTSFRANWEIVTGATGYYLDVALQPTFVDFVVGFNNKDVGSATNYNVSGLAIGTLYYFRVRAYNASETSASSAYERVMTTPVPSDVVALAASGISQSSFYANWQEASLATGYYLYVATDAGFVNHVAGYNGFDVINPDSLREIVKLLTAGTNYWYRLKAYNTLGQISVSYSNVIATATLPQVAPDAPVATAATAVGSYGFTANWNAVAGATGYKIDLTDEADRVFRSFVVGYNSRDVGNVTSYAITGLTASKAYAYRVRAYSADGTSIASNTISVTTLAPPAPSISLSSAMVIFAGTGSANRVTINVTISNALSWYVAFPSTSGYIFNYEWDMTGRWITLYYEGPSPSNDTVQFVAIGNDGTSTVSTTFTGRLM